MAKKSVSLYKLYFDGVESRPVTTKVQSVGRGNGCNSLFLSGAKTPAMVLHTELSWMKVLEQSSKLEFIIIRNEDTGETHLRVVDDECNLHAILEIESYFTIKATEDKVFFELEELPNGKWRMTHSLGILPNLITGARAIVLERI